MLTRALKETEELRLTFYKAVVALIRAYNNVAAEMKEAGYTDKEADQIKKKVDEYTELRNAIKIASAAWFLLIPVGSFPVASSIPFLLKNASGHGVNLF